MKWILKVLHLYFMRFIVNVKKLLKACLGWTEGCWKSEISLFSVMNLALKKYQWFLTFSFSLILSLQRRLLLIIIWIRGLETNKRCFWTILKGLKIEWRRKFWEKFRGISFEIKWKQLIQSMLWFWEVRKTWRIFVKQEKL